MVKRKARNLSSGSGSQPKKMWLEGRELPWWWPCHPVTREPVHKLFRAMSKDFNEIQRLRNCPKNYPLGELTQADKNRKAMDIFQAIDTGSKTVSPFVHLSHREESARWYHSRARDFRGGKRSKFSAWSTSLPCGRKGLSAKTVGRTSPQEQRLRATSQRGLTVTDSMYEIIGTRS